VQEYHSTLAAMFCRFCRFILQWCKSTVYSVLQSYWCI